MKRAVFLDRDGVVNDVQVRNVIVVTKQPDVARGKIARDKVEEINRHLRTQLPLGEIVTCYHDDGDHCDCRIPKPGLLVEAASQYGIDLHNSYMIGDRWRDIDAGANGGCKTVLIDLGYQEREPNSAPDYRARSLPVAVDWILNDDAENV